MAASYDVDLFVIGAGSGGVRAARIAAGHGARVMIAEEYRMGGTCVIRGCVPKKLLVYASHIHHEIEDAAGSGWTIPQVSFDWPTLIANKDKEIARLEAAYTANVEKAGARVLKTRAEFEDAHTLRLKTGEKVRSKYVLIATGGAPNHGAPIPGIEHVISSNEVFHLPSLPRRILIQGGGYIALEFACIFAGFGSDVTVVYRGDNVLRGFDEDVRAHVRSEMEKEGITILTGCTVKAVDKHGKDFTSHLSNGSSIGSDQVMFAIGRHPNVANIGLEKAGVGIGTVYRHFPQRADLVAAVFRHEIDACADAAPILAAEYNPGEALARWMQRYAAFIATKRGLATALHSGNPAFDTLPAYFQARLLPALQTLLDSAVAAGEVRADVNADDLLNAVANLCRRAHDEAPDHARRMVALLIDGLRYGANPLVKTPTCSGA